MGATAWSCRDVRRNRARQDSCNNWDWARAVADHEQGPILALTPLAVAEQTVGEAAKFGIRNVCYAADRDDTSGDIVVTNYERFDKFNVDDFAGVVLDEAASLSRITARPAHF